MSTKYMTRLFAAMKVVGKDDSKALQGQERADITVKQYMTRLVKLNGDKPFTSLKFLQDTDAIAALIKDKAESTRLSYYTAINIALYTLKTYKKLRTKYENIAKPMWETYKSKDVHEKTEKQKEAIVPMDDINIIKGKLKDETKVLNKKKEISSDEYDKYLYHVLVSLYTDIPPRRNMDYSHMVILKKRPKVMDKNKNYLLITEKKFVFNNYKTKNDFGSQEIDIPVQLMLTLKNYFKVRADMKKFTIKSAEVPLLVHYDGKEVYRLNGITKLLNKAFGKNIGSTALRHIYLSDKYGDVVKEKIKDASNMSHSLSVQNEYIKF